MYRGHPFPAVSPSAEDVRTGSDLDRTVSMVHCLLQENEGEALAFMRNHRVRPTRRFSLPS